VKSILDHFFSKQVRDLAENEYGYIRGHKHKDLQSEYENLLSSLEEVEQFNQKAKEELRNLSENHVALLAQNNELKQKFDNLDDAYNKLKNENVLIYAKAKANNQKVQRMFIDAMSETLKLRLITSETSELLSPHEDIQHVLESDDELNHRFAALIETYKTINNDLYESFKSKEKQIKQVELSEKELSEKVRKRQKLFVEINLHQIIVDITENFWFLENHSSKFPESFRAIDQATIKNHGSYEKKEEKTFKLKANDIAYVISLVDTRDHTCLPDGGVWDNFEESYSVTDENGNILCSFKWAYKYDYCMTRENFYEYNISAFKPAEWVDNLSQLNKLINTVRNQKDPTEEAAKKTKRINSMKGNFDL
jgi:hypothetical protein